MSRIRSTARRVVAVAVLCAPSMALISDCLSGEVKQTTGSIKAIVPSDNSVILKEGNGCLVELKLGPKAAITCNGKAVGLNGLKPGMRVVASVRDGAISELAAETAVTSGSRKIWQVLPIDEVNTAAWDGEPWLSPDGLTIYWVSGSDRGLQIWTATRKTPESLFQGKRLLCKGMCPTVTADGLQMFFIDRPDGEEGFHVYSTKRTSVDDLFDRPRLVPELSGRRAWGPALSQDGLTLYFLGLVPEQKKSLLQQSKRRSLQSAWAPPTDLPIPKPDGPQGDIEYQFVTSDGLTMYADLKGRIMVWTRTASHLPFTKHELLDLPGFAQSSCFAPRYVERTNEFFFCATPPANSRLGKQQVDLYLIKDFRENTK